MRQAGVSVYTNQNGNQFAIPYVYTNGEWVPALPKVYNENEWKTAGLAGTLMVYFMTSDNKYFMTSDGKYFLVRD